MHLFLLVIEFKRSVLLLNANNNNMHISIPP